MIAVVTDDVAKKNLAANIKRLLAARGISMRELARLTGESAMTISHICGETRMPGAGIVLRIAEALDVNMDRLFDEPPESTPETRTKKLRQAS